jgi:hypothetical protein
MSFSRYNTDDQVVSSETVVRGLWSGDSNTLDTFFTSSTYTEYYVDVYNGNPVSSTSAIQFNIQFGNLYGSGSNAINPNVSGSSPSRIVYGQYRNLVYGTENTNFSFNNSVTASSIYIINIARSRYKESLLPGSFELTLSSGSTSNRITLIDDSTTTNISRFLGENRYYNIISGSIASGSFSTAINYGFFLPDLGIAILDSGSLSKFIPPVTTTLPISPANYNHLNLYRSIVSGSAIGGLGFKLQSSETVSSTYFFTRVKNSEFNYTTNPSIIDDNGNLLYTTLINSPQTFPTTVGLYNDNNELLAVAKMSRPLTKDFTKEALIRIKIDY